MTLRVERGRLTKAGHGLPIEDQFGYSGAASDDELVHVSGQLARDASGRQVPGEIAMKTSIALSNVGALLEALGSNLEDVVQLQAFVTAPISEAIPVLREQLREHVPHPAAAATVARVAGLNDECGLLEIAAVARSRKEGNTLKTIRVVERSRLWSITDAEVVAAGNYIFVSAQMSVDDAGQLLHPGSLSKQFAQAIDNVGRALAEVGAGLSSVVSLLTFTIVAPAPGEFAAICEAHRRRLGDFRPTGTMVRVVELPLEGALVSVSATAVRA